MIRDREWVRRRLDAGDTVAELAAAAGVSRQTASSWLRRHGLKANKQPVERPSPSELLAAYERAGSTTALGEQLGVSQAAASRWLIEAGIATRPQARPRKAVSGAEVRRRRSAGESWAEIAAALDISVSTARSRSKGP